MPRPNLYLVEAGRLFPKEPRLQISHMKDSTAKEGETYTYINKISPKKSYDFAHFVEEWVYKFT